MGNLKEDGEQTVSHRVISVEGLLNTHSRPIKELLQQISKSYNISIKDAAFAVSNAMARFSEMK